MALYFQLTRVGSSEPSTFQSIDCAICQSLGLPFDSVNYAFGWYDVIGFMLAAGNSFAEITDYLNTRINDAGLDMAWRNDYITLRRICHYLLENYTADNWYGK